MPPTLILILFAFALYTLVIFLEKVNRRLKPWMVIVFTVGFLFDLSGTIIMALGGGAPNAHIICGSLAIVIMGLHLAWAILALKFKGRSERLFSRYSVYAWLVWLSALFSGIPK